MTLPLRAVVRGILSAATLVGALTLAVRTVAAEPLPAHGVRIANGVLIGTAESGLRVFRGIPYAQPPVGEFRWKPPQPVKNWVSPLDADTFGPRAMQLPLFGDMVFRSSGMSEDCLYLNVWTPAKSGRERLPVLVYFFGGGFVGGDGSEPRYDGASLARRGIVSVTVTFRLGAFGFLAHPELTRESPHHASGNYGLMDQSAALRWVKRNIKAFGGDPSRVTIAGESAGSYSVSAQMASPWSKDLIAGAIGESGSLMGTRPPVSLADAERNGVTFATSLGETSLAALRSMPANEILDATSKPGAVHFGPIVDGDFMPRPPAEIYAAGAQARVPLLLGWNSQESGPQGILGKDAPTPENFSKAVQTLYGNHAADLLKAYSASTDAEAAQAATDLASDRFIAYSTWKWYDLHRRTGNKPVFRYYFSRPRPGGTGAVHSGEIEYALGNLPTNSVYAWTPDDYKVSDTMETYFANFIKGGNPNGPSLPEWPAVSHNSAEQVMHLDVNTHAEPDTHRERYLALEHSLGIKQ